VSASRVGRASLAASAIAAVATALVLPVVDVGARGRPAPRDAWRQLGYDVGSSFHNPNAGITPRAAAGLHEAWRFEAPGPVNGAAAVVGGRAYILSGDGLVALDADRGDEIWRRDDVTGTSSPTLVGGTLYVQASEPSLYALDPKTGADRWTARTDDQQYATGFSSPVLTGNAVVVGLASVEEVAAKSNAQFRGGAAAFDRRTGDELWRYRTAEPPFNGVGVWSTPSYDPELELVYITTGNNYTESAGPSSDSIVALDAATGEQRWIRQVTTGDVFTIGTPISEDSDLGTNPILFDAEIDGTDRRLLGAGQKSGMFWVLDRETGAVVWQRQVSGGSSLIGGVFNNGAYDGQRIVVAGNNGPSPKRPQDAPAAVLMALDPATGEIQWQRDLDEWVWAPITLGKGVGFVATGTDLQAFDLKRGKELATFSTEGTITSAPVVVAGRVYFGSGLSYLGGTKPGTTFYALEP
jgi:polyvinyl alcohol dehydrogenase (cytochrome)